MPSRALVTGAGRGIGAGIARELADAGWHVTVTGRTAEQVESVAREIGGAAVVGDVSRREDVERMVAAAEPVDLLVANAGIGVDEDSAWEVDLDEWWHVFETNVLGVHLCCRAVIPGMLDRGHGRIVITGSGASYLPGASATAYTASKAAVCRYGEVLANRARRSDSSLRDQPRPRAYRPDGRTTSGTTRRGRRRNWRRSSSASLRRAASMPSPGATSMPSTTRRTCSRRGSTASSPRI